LLRILRRLMPRRLWSSLALRSVPKQFPERPLDRDERQHANMIDVFDGAGDINSA